jgi:sugar lactone lactonase YvrE
MIMASFEQVGDTLDMVGESPTWDHRSGRLLWVDIVGKAVRWRDLTTNQTFTHAVEGFPTALALTSSTEQVVLTIDRQFGHFDLASGTFSSTAELEPDSASLRLNEGKCDPAGRFWTASMDNNLHADGSPRKMKGSFGRLFSVAGNSVRGPFAADLGIPNTMAWSPAGDVFYLGDTMRNIIWAYDYDAERGVPSHRRIFAEGGPGLPDGSTVDADGFLWNARFGGGCIIRFTPEGRQDQLIPLPVINPTACTFGGPRLETLFVTTGRYGLEKPGLLGGALLAAELNIRGRISNIFDPRQQHIRSAMIER